MSDPPVSTAMLTSVLSAERRVVPASVIAVGKDAEVASPITDAGFEACMAFGAASLAVMDARARAAEGAGLDDAALRELCLAHERLRDLFAVGATDGVAELALSVMVLAERVGLPPS